MWLLARAQTNARAAAVLSRHLTPGAVAAEVVYLRRPEAHFFEAPYGWAWLLALAAELKRLGAAPAARWREAAGQAVLAAGRHRPRRGGGLLDRRGSERGRSGIHGLVDGQRSFWQALGGPGGKGALRQGAARGTHALGTNPERQHFRSDRGGTMGRFAARTRRSYRDHGGLGDQRGPEHPGGPRGHLHSRAGIRKTELNADFTKSLPRRPAAGDRTATGGPPARDSTGESSEASPPPRQAGSNRTRQVEDPQGATKRRAQV